MGDTLVLNFGTFYCWRQNQPPTPADINVEGLR